MKLMKYTTRQLYNVNTHTNTHVYCLSNDQNESEFYNNQFYIWIKSTVSILSGSYFKLVAIKTSMFTLSGKRLMFTMLPAALKACSEGTEVAATARYLVANCDSRG